MATQDWHIKSRADQCLTCERPFEDNENICSQLGFGEEGYIRHDHCTECWAKHEEQEGSVSHWRSVYKKPAPPKQEAVQKETAESLLRKLIEEEEPSSLNTIFILTVMLERKRILVEKDVQKNDDGSLVRVYEHKKTGEAFLIYDPQLKLAELEHVQEEVVAMLGGDAPKKGDPQKGDTTTNDQKDNTETAQGEQEPDVAEEEKPPQAEQL